MYKNDMEYCSHAARYTDFDMHPLNGLTIINIGVSRFGLVTQPIPLPGGGVPYNGTTKCNDNCLFEWNTMYIGFNRVISGGGRVGSGLCNVHLTWDTANVCDN